MGIFTRYLVLLVIVVLQHQGNYTVASNSTQPHKCIATQECCRFPQLFKQNAFDYCKDKVNLGKQCLYECVYAVTELCRPRECDNRKAADYIDWIWPGEHDFKNVYKRAFEQCIAQVTNETKEQLPRITHQDSNECNPQPEKIQQCVEHKLFTICPVEYFNNDKPTCIEQRTFWEACGPIY